MSGISYWIGDSIRANNSSIIGLIFQISCGGAPVRYSQVFECFLSTGIGERRSHAIGLDTLGGLEGFDTQEHQRESDRSGDRTDHEDADEHGETEMTRGLFFHTHISSG